MAQDQIIGYRVTHLSDPFPSNLHNGKYIRGITLWDSTTPPILKGKFAEYWGCYLDFSEAQRAYTLAKSASEEDTFLLRVSLLNVDDYEIWRRIGVFDDFYIHMEIINYNLVQDEADWSLLGFEVCNSEMESGLVNASDRRDAEILTEVFGPSVNDYALFDDEKVAKRFAHIVGQAAEEENSCPMIVFKYERILEPELPPVNPANG